MDLKNKTILVVEDIEINFRLIQAIFSRTNVNLLKAGDGDEAIDAFRTNKDIDLVLMDIKLPGMNGYEVTRQLKSIRKEVPIIAQTAYSMDGDLEKALQAGCDEYVSKPINKSELMDKVFRLIGN
ncbi:MAG: response regulator [Bacteroidales bacterium]|nr:response regulator [Bacteroidales bacterium]